MTVPRTLWTYTLLLCGSLFSAYVILELGVRVSGLPQKSLMFDMAAEIEKANGDLASHFPADRPMYGWDLPALVVPDSSVGEKEHLLFIGDSVTQGHGVDPRVDSYPALLFNDLNKNGDLRLVNAAVPAFGVDQMVLKLERMVVEYEPAVVVFAYIPHDLWRPGRNINNGITKPVLFGLQGQNWRMLPMPDITEYYQDLVRAKEYFHRGPWVLKHIAENARYYFPRMHMGYYRELFKAIRERLTTLAEGHDMQVLVVRLTSIWPGNAVPALDKLAAGILSPGAANYQFVDTEACVKDASKRSGIDYVEEFSWHPGRNGHTIYAECLRDILSTLVATVPIGPAPEPEIQGKIFGRGSEVNMVLNYNFAVPVPEGIGFQGWAYEPPSHDRRVVQYKYPR